MGTFYSLNHSSSNKFKWQLCVIIVGGFRVESLAGLDWNEWQLWVGIRNMVNLRECVQIWFLIVNYDDASLQLIKKNL